jgi:hypothetical protein
MRSPLSPLALSRSFRFDGTVQRRPPERGPRVASRPARTTSRPIASVVLAATLTALLGCGSTGGGAPTSRPAEPSPHPSVASIRAVLVEQDWPPAFAACVAPLIEDEVGSVDDLRRMILSEDDREGPARVEAAQALDAAVDACGPHD